MKKALNYAKMSCDTMMRKFEAKDLPPIGKFHYHQGVFLSGMLNTYKLCGDEKYFEYVKKWVDSIIYEDGSIHTYNPNMLDDIQPGILLSELYKKTTDKRYITAREELAKVLKNWHTNPIGGFWHKEFLPNEMWLDGLYMAGPLSAEYSSETGDMSFLETAVSQIIIMYENMQDKNTRLLYHAWDYNKKCIWADKETGLSSEFWGRALGWYVVAILDILEYMPKNHPKRQKIIEIEKDVLAAIVFYQDKVSGMWYQIVNKGEYEDNWLESSCTALFIYALAKAVRFGVINSEYLKTAKRGYEGLVSTFVAKDGDDLLISGICIGTGVCDYEQYISRETSINDLHGVGAFLLMCTELARIED